MDELQCQVIEITRGTTHDGPGMRTTVFLQGCPLRCQWCQNPESIQTGRDIWWEQRKCIRCLACLKNCSSSAIYEDGGGLHRDRSKCILCGNCVEECPAQAMTFTSRQWSLEQLLKEALKDKDFYQVFSGGVTVSGGEPLSQATFVREFFKQLQANGVHTALDTCGLAPVTALHAVLPYTNAVLFDIKLADPELHKRYTGQSNEKILANLLLIAHYIHSQQQENKQPIQLWLRTPLIPDTTASEDNITEIAAFIRNHLLDVLQRWELCAFNNACYSKYQKMGLPWQYENNPLMPQGAVNHLRTAALSSGIAADKLVVTGLLAKES